MTEQPELPIIGLQNARREYEQLRRTAGWRALTTAETDHLKAIIQQVFEWNENRILQQIIGGR